MIQYTEPIYSLWADLQNNVHNKTKTIHGVLVYHKLLIALLFLHVNIYHV